MHVVPFLKEHLAQMGGALEVWAARHIDHAASLEGGMSFTAVANGNALASGGVVRLWEGRYLAWFYAGPLAKKHWKSIHKATRQFLADLDANRVEADVACDWPGAVRWIESLGFTLEAPRRKRFMPDGRDAALYALVKE